MKCKEINGVGYFKECNILNTLSSIRISFFCRQSTNLNLALYLKSTQINILNIFLKTITLFDHNNVMVIKRYQFHILKTGNVPIKSGQMGPLVNNITSIM